MTPIPLNQAMQLAMQYHQVGKLAEAEEIYRQILAQQPENSRVLHLLGVIAAQNGQMDEAIGLIQRAIAIKPDVANYHSNLGNALRDKGLLSEAAAAYRQAIQLKPNHALACNNLGNALSDLGQLDEAIAVYRHAVELRPDHAGFHNNLGKALNKLERYDEAIAEFRQALQLEPGMGEVRNNLGNALLANGLIVEAEAIIRDALRLNPEDTDLLSTMGNVHFNKGELDEAVVAYRKVQRLRPRDAKLYSNLGHIYRVQGRLDEAISAYRQAIVLDPNAHIILSDLVFTLHYCEAFDSTMLLAESRRWGRQHGDPLKQFIPSHMNDRSPDRRLKIGYVSGDFRNHVVARNVLPLFREYDRGQFEFFCYYNDPRSDEFTERFRALADGWRDISRTSDEAAAEMILGDRIDILVDLSLHSTMNRLLVFARKPAPVQVAFAGYPGTTGLDTIDYRLTDPYLDPPGQGDEFYSETSYRLKHSFWCYDPVSMEVADGYDVNPAPAVRNGYVTFGCLNYFGKVNAGVVELWSRVLAASGNSRLLLLAVPGLMRQRLLDQFADLGVDGDRIQFADRQKRENYLRMYDQVDIGLDTLPYNGHTTSLDALWMGVPVVTLIGRTVVGRAGYSMLMNLGLPELVARTPEEYVGIAAGLAGDLPRLSGLRLGLRERMENSPLTHSRGFSRDIETAYRQMWRKWCVSGK